MLEKIRRVKIWQENLKKALSLKNFGSEGLAINMSVYIDNVETEFLPLNCNWIVSNLLPKFDEQNNSFVEPFCQITNWDNALSGRHLERWQRYENK